MARLFARPPGTRAPRRAILRPVPRPPMYTLLYTILVLVSLVLIAAVLLQSGKGNGLASSFGGASSAAESVIGSRQAGNLLTRTTWWAGGLFVGISFILGILGQRERSGRSVLDQSFAPATRTAPASSAPAGGAAPAVPLSPAAPALPTSPAGNAAAANAPAGNAPAGNAPAGAAPAGGVPAPRR